MINARNRKRHGDMSRNSVDSTIILGDLTDVNQISRSGNVVTLHGRQDPRSFTLPDATAAVNVWQALADEAAEAVQEDRQFFCVTFGSDASPQTGTMH